MNIKISKEVLVLSLVVGLGLLFLSFYIFYTSILWGDKLLAWHMHCFPGSFAEKFIESSQIKLIFDWFETGVKFSKETECNRTISNNFPYIFWLGWIITLVSLYLNFRTIEKIK